jgi:hypothetical protein
MPRCRNNSQGFHLYSYEPGGNRIEINSGSYLVFAADWEPVTWDDQDQERARVTYWVRPYRTALSHMAHPISNPTKQGQEAGRLIMYLATLG